MRAAEMFDPRQGLIDRGMPEHVADAFVMNFRDESGLNPGINEAAPLVPGSRGGFGLSQWTGPRRRNLEAFAQQRGAPVADPDLQLDFLMQELNGPEKAAWQAIQQAPDAPTAAAAIVNKFLRPAEEHRARREAKYLGGQGGAPAGQAPQQPASPAQSALSALFAQGGPLARQDDAAVPVDPLRTASAPQAGGDADRARRSRLAQMMVY